MRNKALTILLAALTLSCSASREAEQDNDGIATNDELGYAAVQYTLAAMEANVKKSENDTAKFTQRRHVNEKKTFDEISSKYKADTTINSLAAQFYLDLIKSGCWDLTAELTIGILKIDSIERNCLSDYKCVLNRAATEKKFCDESQDIAYFDKAGKNVKSFLSKGKHITIPLMSTVLVLCMFVATILLTLATEHKIIPLLLKRRRHVMDAKPSTGENREETVNELSVDEKNQLKLSDTNEPNESKHTSTRDVPPKSKDEQAAPAFPSPKNGTKPDKASKIAQTPTSENTRTSQGEEWHARIVSTGLEECGESDGRKRFTIKRERDGFSFVFSGNERVAINNHDELKSYCDITSEGKSGIKTTRKGLCKEMASTSGKKRWAVTQKAEIVFY